MCPNARDETEWARIRPGQALACVVGEYGKQAAQGALWGRGERHQNV
jgi:hypothetical protein